MYDALWVWASVILLPLYCGLNSVCSPSVHRRRSPNHIHQYFAGLLFPIRQARQIGQNVYERSFGPQMLTDKIKTFADGFVNIGDKYSPNDLFLPESFDKTTGKIIGVPNLSWSPSVSVTSYQERKSSVSPRWEQGAKGFGPNCLDHSYLPTDEEALDKSRVVYGGFTFCDYS